MRARKWAASVGSIRADSSDSPHDPRMNRSREPMSTVPRSRTIWRRLALAATPAALAVFVFGAGHAAAITDAEKYGTVTIFDADAGAEVVVGGQPHVCKFYFEFDLGI